MEGNVRELKIFRYIYKSFFNNFFKKKIVFSSKNMITFEQSVGFLSKYYFGKNLSSYI